MIVNLNDIEGIALALEHQNEISGDTVLALAKCLDKINDNSKRVTLCVRTPSLHTQTKVILEKAGTGDELKEPMSDWFLIGLETKEGK